MPELTRTTKCRGCAAEIAFIRTAKGKSVPVDPEAVYFIPGGGPDTYVMADGSIQRGRAPETGDGAPWIGYRSHFATCPAADSFRRRRKGGNA